MEALSAKRWTMVAEVAATQWGRVTTRQLRELGISAGAIEKAVRSGRLHPEHRGVYAVGHLAPSAHGGWIGAVLACGDGAALSHRSGAALWRIRSGEGPRVDVTVDSANGRRRRAGIETHRSPLPVEEVTVHEGIRVTTVARTIVDVAHLFDEDELRRTVREAQYLRRFELAATVAAAARRPSAALTRILDDMTATSSELDDAFVTLLRRHRFPMPNAQKRLLGHDVDYVWPAQRVAVELDGYGAHLSVDAFQRDRSQGNALALAGWLLLRFTWADVARHPRATVRTLRRALGA